MLDLPFTMEFVVYLTNRCNLRCSMCSQYGENFKENACSELYVDEWKRFFSSIADTNPVPQITLIGGEPLLYKDFDELLVFLNQKKFRIHIVTNGFFLDKHLSSISECENISITVSLDGLEDIHDSIRGQKGVFKKAIENISELNKIRSKCPNLRILINSVLLPENIDQTSDFLQYIQTQNIDQVVFQHLQFLSKEQNRIADKEWMRRLNCHFTNNLIPRDSYVINMEYVNKLKMAIANLKKVCSVETFIFPYLTDTEIDKYYLDTKLDTIRPYLRCSTPWITAFIDPMGNVSNCIENNLGNITKDLFWDIWNNEKANKFRQNLCEAGNFSICTKCCNFYKSNFLYANNSKININGDIATLPAELNFVLPSPELAFVLDESKSTIKEKFAIPLAVHSSKMLEELNKNYTILGLSKDIKEKETL